MNQTEWVTVTGVRKPHRRLLSMLVFWSLAALVLPACSSLPKPGGKSLRTVAGAPDARALVEASAKEAGDAWRRGYAVEVRFDGRWSRIAERVQPGLVDSGFRKQSVEVYEPAAARVRQVHEGPLGKKEVLRTPGRIEVRFNGDLTTDKEKLASAALVADAYALFVFRSSWLAARGEDFRVIGQRTLGGERCWLVEARVRPGFGESEEDFVIAWIGAESGRTHRVQLTLFGLESTAMADVDVTFTEFVESERGTSWPGRYVEFIQRPFVAKAHEWELRAVRLK